ncbi:MAG: FlgD immunoglobulin-like domain containing protein [Candidatus Krumholzibacteriia bacterium]
MSHEPRRTLPGLAFQKQCIRFAAWLFLLAPVTAGAAGDTQPRGNSSARLQQAVRFDAPRNAAAEMGNAPRVAEDGLPQPPAVRADGTWTAIFDDPSPPASAVVIWASVLYDGQLVVAGEFVEVQGAPGNHIARWDGNAWQPFGIGTSNLIYTLGVYRGELIAGGKFMRAGGVAVSHIARWNGFAWAPLGSGVDGEVRALAVHDGDLIVGGDFNVAGGDTARKIARWNGSSWSPMGEGFSGGPQNFGVRALAVHDGTVVAGGWFTSPVGYLAQWDGSAWVPLGSFPADRVVYTLFSSFQGDLYAGAATLSGANWGDLALRWNGLAWIPLGSAAVQPIQGIRSMTTYGGELVVGGAFPAADGTPASNIATWDLVGWDSLGSGTNDHVLSLIALGDSLVVGGQFTIAGGDSAPGLAIWDGASWQGWEFGRFIAGNGINGSAYALAAHAGDVYVGGDFTTAGSLPVEHIARWDGSQWHALGAGVNDRVLALASWNGNMITAGRFTEAGGAAANRIARWDGSSWHPMGDGFDDDVYALAVSGSDLFAAGRFIISGVMVTSRVARWAGDSWSNLGTGLMGEVDALTSFEGDLIAGGDFLFTGGGVPAARVARWNGTAWSALDAGFASRVHALAVVGGSLYAGGDFTSPPNHVARWNGSSWLPLGLGVTGGTDPTVYALSDLGGALVVAGRFTLARDVGVALETYHIAQWDGSAWSSFDTGSDGTVRTVLALDSLMYVGGSFTKLGDKPSWNIGLWVSGAPATDVSERHAPPPNGILEQNFPNPFNPRTSIRYWLGSEGEVLLRVFDVRGRLVRTLVDERRKAGLNEVRWSGRDDAGHLVVSGTYICRIDVRGRSEARKIVLVR